MPSSEHLPVALPAHLHKEAVALDCAAPLHKFHTHFSLPPGVVYLFGSSLGLHPLAVAEAVQMHLRKWTTAGLFLQTHLSARGVDPVNHIERLILRPGEHYLLEADILARIEQLHEEDRLSLFMLPGVQFYTGQAFAIASIAAACNQCGILIGLDLAHSVGNIPLHLHDCGVEFAAWCSYKYLCSGPGAVSGVFVHARYDENTLQALPRHAGWWGHDDAHPAFDLTADVSAF